MEQQPTEKTLFEKFQEQIPGVYEGLKEAMDQMENMSKLGNVSDPAYLEAVKVAKARSERLAQLFDNLEITHS